jgi:hypothetical protein
MELIGENFPFVLHIRLPYESFGLIQNLPISRRPTKTCSTNRWQVGISCRRGAFPIVILSGGLGQDALTGVQSIPYIEESETQYFNSSYGSL